MVEYLKKIGALVLIMCGLFYAAESSAELIGEPSLVDKKSIKGLKRLKLGKFNIMPSLLFKAIGDTNALYADSNTRADAIFEVKPGVDIMAFGSKIDLLAGYSFLVHENVKADVQDFLGHEVTGEIFSRPFSKRMFIKLTDNMLNTAEPADPTILDNTAMLQNNLNISTGYITRGDDLQLSVGYLNSYRRFSDIYTGYMFYGRGVQVKSMVNLSSRYRFLPKTQATFNFEYTSAKQDYDDAFYGETLRSDQYRITAGLEGAFTRKLSILAKAGYNRIDYRNFEVASNFVTETAVNFLFTRKIKLRAGYARKADYSVYSPYSTIHTYTFYVDYKFSKKLRFKSELDMDDIDYSGPVQDAAGGTRDDFVIRYRFDTVYKLRPWLSFIMGYKLENRGSNAFNFVQGNSTAEFTRHSFYFGCGFNYR